MGPRPYQCGLPDRREAEVADHPPRLLRHQRQAECPGLAQGAHDQLFVVIGMGGIEERGHGQRFNGVVIGACFGPNDDVHRFSPFVILQWMA